MKYLTTYFLFCIFAVISLLKVYYCEKTNPKFHIKSTEGNPGSRWYILSKDIPTYRVHSSYTRLADCIEHKTKLETKVHNPQAQKSPLCRPTTVWSTPARDNLCFHVTLWGVGEVCSSLDELKQVKDLEEGKS